MFTNRPSRRGAFTLVEMLVVLGIIAILIALLMPAVMAAVNRGRITRMGTEIAQLKDAIEKYKVDKGDYPPNFRDVPAFVRHLRRCYPKINDNEYKQFFQVDGSNNLVLDMYGNPQWRSPNFPLDEGESLVFWLSRTRTNAQFPFTASGVEFNKYYDFSEQRLVDDDGNGVPSFRPEYAKETYYIYIDSRSYDELVSNLDDPATAAYAELNASAAFDPSLPLVRPYWSESAGPDPTSSDPRLRFQPMNPTSYQLLCAGQDGDFGYSPDGTLFRSEATPDSDNVAFFPSGGNYFRGDKDNITNFSEGRRLVDHIP